MKPQYDLVIRNGTIADGTGGPLREGDLAINNGHIVALGAVSSQGKEEVDAKGLLVTPGFVDLHTHYDGQAAWDERLVPSSWHGVTTAVMGNCGVGFAPVKPKDRERLLELMEGVEDIPGAVLREGINWRWNSFGEYLDMLEAMPHDIDLCAQLAHGPLRIFVMGERATAMEPATAEDIALMRQLTAQAISQGAVGFSTTRTLNHRSAKGENTPSFRALEDELIGIAMGLRDAGRGVFQFISDWDSRGLEAEFAMMRRLVEGSGRPLSFSLGQMHARPDEWRRLLELTQDAVNAGLDVRAQVAPRSIAILQGLQSSLSFFCGFPSYDALAGLPLPEKLAVMKNPLFREQLLREQQAAPESPIAQRVSSAERIFLLGNPPVYEPSPETSLQAIAARSGRSVSEVAYDHLVAGEGGNLLFAPINNYAGRNLDACREMLANKNTLMGLGDGGAHVSFISDASFTTFLLTHWARDRLYGKFSVEWAVRRLTSDNARFIGLHDRGELVPGKRADVNLIDLDNLQSCTPFMADDLPCGGQRLLQKATGYRRTLVAGVTTYLDGEPTSALPGKLVRSSTMRSLKV